MFCMLKRKKTHLAYVSKQAIVIIIRNGEEWHYLTVKKLSALLRGITSKHHGDFYCLNGLHSFATENKHESHIKLCNNKNFYNVVMPSEDTKILEINQYQKSEKAPFLLFMQILNV